MERNKKYKKRGSTLTLVGALVVLIALVVAIILWPVEGSAKSPSTDLTQDDLEATTLIHAGDKAPDFSVEMLDGSTVTLSSLQGKPVLLIFWATWCPPCREELSHLQEGVIDRYGDAITVLPISRGEERTTVENFLSKMGYTFAVGLDGDQSIYRKYASNYIPRCFVIDAQGVVKYAGVGYDEEIAATVNKNLEACLK
jgi:peroxiredoxin